MLPFENVTISALQATMVVAVTKYGEHTPFSPSMDNGFKLGILMSEVGEVADAMIANHHNKDLFKELLQVSAMALAWAQCIDNTEVVMTEQEKMEQVVMHIADSAYVEWSDFVEELTKMRVVTYTTPGWVTYLNEETERFIAWNDRAVEETISAHTHG
jgi:hypothetical protein